MTRSMEITRINPDFAVSSQLQRDDLRRLAKAGFRAIVNNRPDGEAPDQPNSQDIEVEARRLELDYIHIPIVPGEMTEAQARKLKRFLQGVPGPAVGFCRTGNRSTSLWKLAQKVT